MPQPVANFLIIFKCTQHFWLKRWVFTTCGITVQLLTQRCYVKSYLLQSQFRMKMNDFKTERVDDGPMPSLSNSKYTTELNMNTCSKNSGKISNTLTPLNISTLFLPHRHIWSIQARTSNLTMVAWSRRIVIPFSFSLIFLLRCLTKPFAIATVCHVTSPLDLLHSAVLALVHVDIAQARYH